MKYKALVYGPFGPKQRAAEVVFSFNTRKEFSDYIKSKKTLEVVKRAWREV